MSRSSEVPQPSPRGRGELVVTAEPGHLSPGRIVTGLVAAAAVIMAVTGVVKLVGGEDRFDAAMTLGGGLLVLVLALLAFVKVQKEPGRTLRIDHHGLTVVRGTETTALRWDEIDTLHAVGGAYRMLIVERHGAERAAGSPPRRSALLRAAGSWSPGSGPQGIGSPRALRIPLDGLDADEFTILTAIHELSERRFPSNSRPAT